MVERHFLEPIAQIAKPCRPDPDGDGPGRAKRTTGVERMTDIIRSFSRCQQPLEVTKRYEPLVGARLRAVQRTSG